MATLDVKRLDSILERRADELRRSLMERGRIVVAREADPFDERLLAAEREASAQILTRDFRLLRQVESARTRLREGAFGICSRCEEEIAPKRLQAIPWAMYCVSCQAMEESESFPRVLEQAA